jgi:hypothetical protein
VIKRLIEQDVLPAMQVVESTPWIINRSDLDLAEVQAQVRAVQDGRKLPRTAPDQRELPIK